MFLKIGAAVFCVIHIIHIFLIIVKEVNSSLIDSKIQKSFFLQLDSNKDGQLSFEEFKVLFDNAEKRRKDSEAGSHWNRV